MVIPARVRGEKMTTCVCLPLYPAGSIPSLNWTVMSQPHQQVMLSGGGQPRLHEGEESVPLLLLAEL